MTNFFQWLDIALEAALVAGKKTLQYYGDDFDVIVKNDNSPLTLADLESNRVINEYLNKTKIPILSEENKMISYEVRKNWSRYWLIDPLDGTKEFINKRTDYTINIALIEEGIPVLGVVYAPILELVYYGMQNQGSYKATVSANVLPDPIKEKAYQLKLTKPADKLRVVASRSHLSAETNQFIEKLKKYKSVGDMKSMGSSLKLCMIAEGSADIYPRLGPTMEWDTAASHAVVIYAGGSVVEMDNFQPLTYNKVDLHNPYFIVYNPALNPIVQKLISTG